MNEYDNDSISTRLLEEFELAVNFRRFCERLHSAIPIACAGIARLAVDGTEFEVAAEWHTHEDLPEPGRSFKRTGTVGDMVLKTRRPFVAHTPDAVRKFPGTLSSFQSGNYQSNYVTRLQDREGVVFYVLSPERDTFSVDVQHELERSLATLNQLYDLDRVVRYAASNESVIVDEIARFVDRVTTLTGRHPSMEETENAYLRQLVGTTRFRNEGVLGASSLAGIKPSTLRYRLTQLRKRTLR